MPPKRGRGRGGTAAGASSKVEPQSESELPPPPASTQYTTPPNTAQPNANGTFPSISANNSPASIPTETPASTPATARPPVQRLDSLQNAPRGASARGRASTSRFKPKAVRRTEEERNKVAAEAAAKKAELEKDASKRAAAELRARGRGGRGTGMRGRGRGDAMGRGGLGRGASGPFGMAPSIVSRPTIRHGFGPGDISHERSSGAGNHSSGGGGGSGGGSSAGPSMPSSGMTVKAEPGISLSMSDLMDMETADSARNNVKSEIPEPVYPEEMDEARKPIRRINIEEINLVSDEDEGEDEEFGSNRKDTKNKMKGKGGKGGNGGLRPVRLARVEHKDRITVVNTEPAAATIAEDELAADGSAGEPMLIEGNSVEEQRRRTALDTSRSWTGVWQDEPEPQINSDSEVPQFQLSSTANAGIKPKTKRSSSSKKKKPVIQTEEDKEEYRRYLEDKHILAQELGSIFLGGHGGEANDADNDGDINMEDLAKKTKNKDGRLYLFQFPPILPPLRNSVKQENLDMDVEMVDVANALETHNDTPINVTNKQVHSGTGGDEEIVIEEEKKDKVSAKVMQESGFIGKLIVRKSGKVELDWGGTSLQLEKGASFDFLTTTLIVDGVESSGGDVDIEQGFGGTSKRGDEKKGTSIAMGAVMGKFVATPDWERLLS